MRTMELSFLAAWAASKAATAFPCVLISFTDFSQLPARTVYFSTAAFLPGSSERPTTVRARATSATASKRFAVRRFMVILLGIFLRDLFASPQRQTHSISAGGQAVPDFMEAGS